MPAVKVYNKGLKPIVWKRGLKGIEAIHPRKYSLFGKEKAEEIIKKFDDAVSEKEWEELEKSRIAKIAEDREKQKKANRDKK